MCRLIALTDVACMQGDVYSWVRMQRCGIKGVSDNTRVLQTPVLPVLFRQAQQF